MNRLAKIYVELGLDKARIESVRKDVEDFGEAIAKTGKALTAGLTEPIVRAVTDPDEGEGD